MECSMDFPQKIKNKTTFDPAIPFLVIYPKEVKTGSQKAVCAAKVYYSQQPRYGNNLVRKSMNG